MTTDQSASGAGSSPQQDLYAATEDIRASEFETVPAELLVAVLRAEESNFDSRTTAAREVSRAIDSWLRSQPDSETDGFEAEGEGTVS